MVNIVNFECKLHDASDFVDGESWTLVGDVCTTRTLVKTEKNIPLQS